MKALPRIEGETQCWEHNCEVYVKADDYAALNEYAALVQMERDMARAEVERLRAALTKWDNSLCGCCCHACTELGNVADWLPDPTPASPASTTDA